MRVLVVDDSAFMRKMISEMINAEPDLEVVGLARDGHDAVKKAIELEPDLITLDIEMPKKDGLTALREIKVRCRSFNPVVLMCSSLTVEGSNETLKALRIGAADFIGKDPAVVGKRDSGFQVELISKLKALSLHRGEFHANGSTPDSSSQTNNRSTDHSNAQIDLSRVKAVVVGSSTGGPPTLETIFSKLPAGLKTPIIVAQHMPEIFTKSLANRLDQYCACSADLATHGSLISSPGIHIAQGGMHIRPSRIAGGKIIARLVDSLPGAIYRPSVDHLFETAAKLYGDSLLAIQLTGMGADGVNGAKTINKHGGQIIAQSGDSCVVYGMPKAVIDAGLADSILPPSSIRDLLMNLDHTGSSEQSNQHPKAVLRRSA